MDEREIDVTLAHTHFSLLALSIVKSTAFDVAFLSSLLQHYSPRLRMEHILYLRSAAACGENRVSKSENEDKGKIRESRIYPGGHWTRQSPVVE